MGGRPAGPPFGAVSKGGAELSQNGNREVNHLSQEATLIRAARAKLIEEMCYRLTDLFTVICGRVEIMSERLPGVLREELLTIRCAALKGVEFNKRVLGAAQDCRREIGA